MPNKPATQQQLLAENEDLRLRLGQAEETLREMRSGEVDALMVSGAAGAQLFTLKDADQSFRLLVEEMREGALTMTTEGVIVYANRSFAGLLKTPLEKVMGSAVRTWIAPDSQPILQSLLEKGAGGARHKELSLAAGDGTRVLVYVSVSHLPIAGVPDAYCLLAIDLTEHSRIEAIAASERVARELLAAADQSRDELLRVIEDKTRAEKALAQENKRNHLLIRRASDGVHIMDADGNVLEVSDSFCQMLGYPREKLIGANVSLWDAQWSPQELKHKIAELLGTEGVSVFETRHRRRDGSLFDVEINVQGLQLDGEPVLFCSARDITRRKRAENDIRESEERFRGLIEQSIAGIYIIQDEKLVYVNQRYADIFGYASAKELIGRARFFVVAEKDRAAVEERIRQRFEGELSASYEFRAVCKDGTPIVVGAHAARATHLGRPAIIGLMQDISEKSRAEEQIKRYVEQLEKAFMSTVNVATTLSEMRDPYTTGHERRVAQIAVAIGAELGFDARRQEGLRVAGHLHDVGKINVPSEILSKPGKLTAIEYQLIQGHAQASYDVLKDVEFPWPVAEVALQHHERIDGSGYPQGLKGEAILLEARIMAVADVVEAMSSHRPYRPGLGIDRALAEIERGRGTVYDQAVADACLKLFREDGYTFPV